MLIEGLWDFYYGQLYENSEHLPSIPDAQMSIPDYWVNEITTITGIKTAYGYGTYHHKITDLEPNTIYALLARESAGTATNIFANGEKIVSIGIVATTKENSKAVVRPYLVDVKSDSKGSIDLLIQVSNYEHRKGGLWKPIYFGDKESTYRLYDTLMGSSFFIIGTLLFLFVVNFIMFLLDRKNKSGLFLSLFLLSTILRLSTAGFCIFYAFVDEIPFAIQAKLEYVAMWSAPSAYLLMVCALFSKIRINKKVRNVIIFSQLLLGLITWILPISYGNHLVPVLQALDILMILYIAFLLIRAFIDKVDRISFVMISLGILALGLVLDIVIYENPNSMTTNPFSIAVILFSFVQFIYLSYQQKDLYDEKLVLSKQLRKLNEAYFKFVPKEFLGMLNKEEMTDVVLGDYVETEMTIVFLQFDIFNNNEHEVTPKEQYEAFSEFSLAISPLFSTYNGFISKFISRGFIALFPKSVDDAIECCFAIKKRTKELIEQRIIENKPLFNIGSGIHYGKMILGTIGEDNRLDDTVISDTVNTAARIEAAAESLQRQIIISVEAAKKSKIIRSVPYGLIPLGYIHVKGKENPLSLFECILLEESINAMQSTFEEGIKEKEITDISTGDWL